MAEIVCLGKVYYLSKEAHSFLGAGQGALTKIGKIKPKCDLKITLSVTILKVDFLRAEKSSESTNFPVCSTWEYS